MNLAEKIETVSFDADRPSPKYGLKDLWIEFSQSTGLHAVNKIKPPSISPFSIRGLLWMLSMCSTTAFLVYNLIEEIGDYYSYPTFTKVTPKIRSSIEFPAVTICNRCTLNMTRLGVYPEMENYFFNKFFGSMNESSFPVSDEFQKPLSLEWWRNMSMEGSKMLTECYFGGEEFDCMTKFRPIFTNEGLCHTFNFNVSEIVQVRIAGHAMNLAVLLNINQDHYAFMSNMAAGIKILLHNPRLHPEASSTVVMAAPGFSTYVALQKFEYLYQPLPHMAFDDMECVDTTSSKFVNPLKYYSYYTYKHCIMECVQMKVFNKCGCVGPSDPQDGPRCSLAKQDSCYKPFLSQTINNSSFVGECGCVSECTFDSYTTQVSSSSFPAKVFINKFLNITGAENKETVTDNFLLLRVFYDQMMITSITQQPQYTVASLFSNIGGQMGLCLGASILTVMEITELLVFIILFLCDKCRGRKARNRINNW
ncbi:acid-sensing ion channel 1A-like [Haliotis cracherodii]|uniref:acid-sensing ion channel 1A-like n=1 Tax=Haliotis cracherodii TaxID=6455 RepID=UPI0039ECA10C